MKKRILSIIMMVAVTATMLVGCGGTSDTTENDTTKENETGDADAATEDTTGEDTAAENTDGYTIGINCFGSSSYALLTLANNSVKVFEVFGDQTTVSDDNYQIDKLVQDVENMIAKGVDGLVVWLPTDSLYETVANLCEEHKVPFVLNDKIPTDENIAKKIKANPYFAGAVAPANAVYGEQIAEYALENGYKSCIISSSTVGDPSDTPRLEAFRKTFEAGGGAVVAQLHSEGSDAGQTQIEDALVANPDIDFVYGVGSDYGISACSVLENHGNTDIKVFTSGLDSEALNLLEAGQLELLSGDNWVAGIMSAIVLENFIDENPLKDADGNAVYIENIQPFTLEPNQISLFRKCFIDNFCYADDEVNAMRTKNDSSFNYDKFIEVVDSFSFEERAKALCEAGVVTREELVEAGIN